MSWPFFLGLWIESHVWKRVALDHIPYCPRSDSSVSAHNFNSPTQVTSEATLKDCSSKNEVVLSPALRATIPKTRSVASSIVQGDNTPQGARTTLVGS